MEKCCLPLPRLPGLIPRGLDTLGLVPPVVLVLPVVPAPLSEVFDEFGGPHGLGRGSRFSVRDGWAPESELPPRAEKGLLPNYKERGQTKKGTHNAWNIHLGINTVHTKIWSLDKGPSYLFPGSAEHGFLYICVHPTQGIVASRDALQVAQSPVLVPHHFLHHGWVPGQFHGLEEDI